ncbi:THBS2S [Mytilus edulis]|uniref:THBS2S n=1 Tax=Mytilus edulis TaxID=6550 RepID=A0A8S3Q270_MYTED|nr:THBS2S [Mytilus edulis]
MAMDQILHHKRIKTICFLSSFLISFDRTCSEVSGNWSEWSVWSSCSISCGLGHISRWRECNSPIPSVGGKDCIGQDYGWLWCKIAGCPVHGSWGEWSSWNSCNATLNCEIQDRTRNVIILHQPMEDVIAMEGRFKENTNQVIKAEPSKQFSAGLVVAIAVGCSVVTAVVIIFGLFVFRRLNPNQNGSNNQRLGELPLPKQINDYERSRRSSDTQSGVYDSIEISGRANTQMNSNNEEVYEDLKL